ncbi:MAG: insulinase family protein [Planctomycetota bacterium]|nr:MAG: insulinase family protein [Planctomycetota bacterium]
MSGRPLPIVLAPLLLALLAGCGSEPPVAEDEGGPAAAPAPWPLPPATWDRPDRVPIEPTPAFTPRLPDRLELSNGIVVLLLPDPSRPLVRLELRLRGGDWADPVGKEGLAAFTAAAIREGGSAAWPAPRLDEELARLGAEIDLATGPLRTTARLKCLREDLDPVLGILADLVRRPAFPTDAVERIRDRLLAAVDRRDDRAGPAADREARRAFYGLHDPRVRRMERASLAAIHAEDLAAFHRERYGSRGALLAVVGDFEPTALAARLEAAFGDWGAQEAGPVQVPEEAPAPAGRRVVLWARPGAAQAEIRFLLEGVRRRHPDWPALQFASWALGRGGFGSRMVTRIRTELGLAYTTGAGWQPGWTQQGLFLASCGTKGATAVQATREMLAVLEEFLAEGFRPGEFERTRDRLLNARVFLSDQPEEVLARTADLEWNGYPWSFLEQEEQALRELRPEQVLDACRRHLDPERLLIFLAGDPATFDPGLEEIGPVETWSAAAPAGGGRGGADDPDRARGEDLAGLLLASHGGAAAWLAVGATASRIERGGVPALEAVLVWPGRFLVRLADEPERVLSLVREDAVWAAGADGGLAELGPEEAAAARSGVQAKLPLVLMRLARGEYEVEATGERRLRLRDEEGTVLELELNEHGLCGALVEPDGARYRFGSYSLVGGVMLPTEVVVEEEDGPVAFTFSWRVNPPLEAAWFEPPADR